MWQHATENMLSLTLFDDAGGGAADAGNTPEGQGQKEQGPGARGGTDLRAINRAAFERMIKGEYRDAFAERTQQIIDSRFKDAKGLKARMEALSPVLTRLSERYGVGVDDPAALLKAIATDEEAVPPDGGGKPGAESPAETIDQPREAEQAPPSAGQEALIRRQQAANQTVGDWVRQGEALRQMYPWFNLAKETANPYTGSRFLSLLRSHVPVRAAYELIHRDELLGGAMRYTAQQVRQKTVDDIRARGLRPEENGAHGQGAAQMKRDIRSLSRDERAEIARRAARGERITL